MRNALSPLFIAFMGYNYANFINRVYDKELQALNYSKLNFFFILVHCSLYIIYITISFNIYEAYFSGISHILIFPFKPNYSVMNTLIYWFLGEYVYIKLSYFKILT